MYFDGRSGLMIVAARQDCKLYFVGRNLFMAARVMAGSPINAEYPHCRWTGVRSADYLSAPWAFWPSASDPGAEIRTRPKVRHGAVARWPQTIDSTIDHESGGGTFYAG